MGNPRSAGQCRTDPHRDSTGTKPRGDPAALRLDTMSTSRAASLG